MFDVNVSIIIVNTKYCFCYPGSNVREDEEQTVMFWINFLQEVEGKKLHLKDSEINNNKHNIDIIIIISIRVFNLFIQDLLKAMLFVFHNLQ